MTETMLERAEAIVEAALWSPASGPVSWTPEKIEAMKRQARGIARAVLEAVREPSEAMVSAVEDLDVYWSYRADGRPGEPEDVWRSMIDAALSPSAPPAKP